MKTNKAPRAILAILVLLFLALACNTLTAPSTSSTPREIGGMTIIVGGTIVADNKPSFYLSKDRDGGNPQTEFVPSDTVYILIDASNVPVGTKYEVRWYGLNLEGQDPNIPVAVNKLSFTGASNIVTAWLGNDPGLPIADYKVEVFVDGTSIGSVEFSVKE